MALDKDLLIGEGDGDGVVAAVREYTGFLGVERERHTCPDCGVACEEATTHDPTRAAFDGGESASWRCPECGTHYVREVGDDAHTMDLYGRG